LAAPAEQPALGREYATRIPELLRALECLLFVAGGPVTLEQLAQALQVAPETIPELGGLLAQEYASHGLQVLPVAGGYQLCTRPEYAQAVSRLHQPRPVRLSRAALETLAIIAYRQPVTRPEIEAIRGVAVDGVVETLLQYELVRELGRRSTPGRPMTYGTTDKFLSQFGLFSVQELPDLPDPEPPSSEPTGAGG